ncbi:GNAT family N-acetyltransferase [Noviherbaspirillum massiliense]|uniref:GNAT family N-acetyltransferase n=1 Tax=Noviherbaspirillum massiliense TaxID=1465823 RepID=UPI00030C43F3|nr:GNAT family N-acetyltransferase [Noviherbaspirillum massiliense]
MTYHLTLGDWDALKNDAQPIRYEVFVTEQKVPVELEWDEWDAECLHALVRDSNGNALGTGRLLPDGHIGRMAVRAAARGLGIGGMILRALMQAAKQRGDASVVLNAQVHAAPFYERFGFVREGEDFMEAGIPHIQMRHGFR